MESSLAEISLARIVADVNDVKRDNCKK